ncbi:MAG: chorismate-binding protein, partial [Kurthia sp.]
MNNELFLSEEIAMSKEGFFYSYKKQTQQEPYHLFLESGRGGMQSIAAWNPLAIVSSNEKGIHIKWRDGREEVRFGESLTLIEELTQAYALHNVPTHLFTGGVVGAISYDYNRKIEKIASVSEEDLRLPDHYFYLIDCWAVFNELKQTVQVMKTSTSEVDLEHYLVQFQEKSIEERQFHENTQIMNHQVKEMKVSMESKQFEEAVDRIQKYIEQGDVFQVNLSVRQSKVFKAKPIDLYEALRTFNPSPYMAMIQSPDFAIVSGSPELLVKKQGLELSTRPIAGTRPRGKDHSEDLALAKELIDNPKERAEHVMLVDLERNDLGKVSKYGTV